MKFVAVAVLLAAVAAMTGCASKTGPTGPAAAAAQVAPPAPAVPAAPGVPVTGGVPAPASLSPQQAAATYLALVAPANAASNALDTLVTKPSARITVAQVSQALAAAEHALDAFDNQLAVVAWPVDAVSDVKLLIDANQAVEADWYGAEQDLDADALPSSLTTGTDRGQSTAAAAKVRADLSLAPPPGEPSAATPLSA
jgi:hypothetical protein